MGHFKDEELRIIYVSMTKYLIAIKKLRVIHPKDPSINLDHFVINVDHFSINVDRSIIAQIMLFRTDQPWSLFDQRWSVNNCSNYVVSYRSRLITLAISVDRKPINVDRLNNRVIKLVCKWSTLIAFRSRLIGTDLNFYFMIDCFSPVLGVDGYRVH